MAQELEAADEGSKPCTDFCFIQFLGVGRSQVGKIISVAVGIFLFAGVGARNPRVAAKGPAEDDARVIPLDERVDITLWFPSRKVDQFKVQWKHAHERPIEWAIVCIKPSKNYSHGDIVIVPAEGRGTGRAKFGSRGGDGGVPFACHENTLGQDDGSDVDDGQERGEANSFRSKVRDVARKVVDSPRI